MKVLYVLAYYPQNSEAYVDAEMSYVIGRGINVAVWSPRAGYGDKPRVQVYRDSLAEAIGAFRPDVIHIHHMTTAAYYLDQLPDNGSTTIRAHSFDWDDALAARLIGSSKVRRIFAFPHLARRANDVEIEPMPVAYDPSLYYRSPKDRNLVVRVSAGLPTKRLEDFIDVGNQLAKFARFTLAMNMVVGLESTVVEKMRALNQLQGGQVKILTNLSRADVSALVRDAGIYVSTYDEKSHPFGMPISIAEAQATGAVVLVRDGDPAIPGVAEYLGPEGIRYLSPVGAAGVIRSILDWKDADWKDAADSACRNAERFRSDVVLPRLVEEWNRICLDNF
jgi:hypothetical protein